MSEEIEAEIIELAKQLKGENPIIRVRKVTGDGIEVYIVYREGKS